MVGFGGVYRADTEVRLPLVMRTLDPDGPRSPWLNDSSEVGWHHVYQWGPTVLEGQSVVASTHSLPDPEEIDVLNTVGFRAPWALNPAICFHPVFLLY